MSEETKPAATKPQTDPGAKGSSTSEFKFATVVAALGAVLSGTTLTFNELHGLFPTSGWIGVAVGALTTIGALLSYISGRTKIKTAIIESGTAVVAAEQAALATQRAELTAANPTPRP